MSSLPINIEEKLDEKEKAFIERALTLTTSAHEHSKKYFHDRERFRRRYVNDVDVEKADWQAQIAHPLPHLAVERKASFLTDAVMGSATRPLFKARPWENINSTRKAAAYTKYMQQQQSQMPLTEIFYTAFKEMLTVGTSILHTYWDNRIEEIMGEPTEKISVRRDPFGNPLINPMTGQPEFDIKTVAGEPEIIERTNRPGIEVVNIDNFWVDPAATSLDDARFVIRRKFFSLNDLKHFEKLGRIKNVDLLKGTNLPFRESSENALGGRRGRFKHYNERHEQRITENVNADPDNPIIEVMEFCEPGKISLIGNGLVPLDIERAVYRSRFPFIRLVNLPQINEFFGLSEYVVCERLFAHVDQMQNMIFDNWEQHLKGITLIGAGVSETAKKELEKGESGSVIRVGSLDDIRTERPAAFDGSVVAGMGMLLQECKDSLSIDGAISGAGPGSEVRDSQSFEIFTRISQVTLSVTVRRIQESIRELGMQWHKLNKQFLQDKVRIRVAGMDALETMSENDEVIIDPRNPADLPGNLDLDVQLTALADVRRDREIRQMVDAINLGTQDPTFRFNEAMVQLFSKLDVFEDALDLFEKDPEKILKRASVNAIAAGKKVPVLAGRFGNGAQGGPTGQPSGAQPVPQ
mgnify:CR=1 FL=1